jgi:heme A synthase
MRLSRQEKRATMRTIAVLMIGVILAQLGTALLTLITTTRQMPAA